MKRSISQGKTPRLGVSYVTYSGTSKRRGKVAPAHQAEEVGKINDERLEALEAVILYQAKASQVEAVEAPTHHTSFLASQPPVRGSLVGGSMCKSFILCKLFMTIDSGRVENFTSVASFMVMI